jgi:hypothetical protein
MANNVNEDRFKPTDSIRTTRIRADQGAVCFFDSFNRQQQLIRPAIQNTHTKRCDGWRCPSRPAITVLVDRKEEASPITATGRTTSRD